MENPVSITQGDVAMTAAAKEPTAVELTAAALAKARERREAVKQKQADNELRLFDLGLKKQSASDAHAVALLADGDTKASRKQLDATATAIEDAELLKSSLVTAASEAGGQYNLAV